MSEPSQTEKPPRPKQWRGRWRWPFAAVVLILCPLIYRWHAEKAPPTWAPDVLPLALAVSRERGLPWQHAVPVKEAVNRGPPRPDAWYDTWQEAVYLNKEVEWDAGVAGDSDRSRAIFHELVHALDHQTFESTMRPFGDAFVVSGLLEGDAEIVTARCRAPVCAHFPDLPLGELLRDRELDPLPQAQAIAKVHRWGGRFGAVLMRFGGLAAFDEAFRAPPADRSLLERPVAYLQQVDQPWPLDQAGAFHSDSLGISVGLPPGWTRRVSGPFEIELVSAAGEQLTYVFVPDDLVDTAALRDVASVTAWEQEIESQAEILSPAHPAVGPWGPDEEGTFSVALPSPEQIRVAAYPACDGRARDVFVARSRGANDPLEGVIESTVRSDARPVCTTLGSARSLPHD